MGTNNGKVIVFDLHTTKELRKSTLYSDMIGPISSNNHFIVIGRMWSNTFVIDKNNLRLVHRIWNRDKLSYASLSEDFLVTTGPDLRVKRQ